MSKKIKILICSHSAALHTGLSETQRNIFIPLISKYKDKYDIVQLGYFHFAQQGEPIPWPIYRTKVQKTPQGDRPVTEDSYGQLSFNQIVAEQKPDIVFGYGDMWHFEHMLTSPLRNTYRFLSYYTIDGQPYFGNSLDVDGNTEWGPKLSKADEIVVLSHFGKEVLLRGNKEIKDRDISVMYHPIDMSRYPVLTDNQISDIRSKILPKHINSNAFICGWVGKNQFRKQNYRLWEITHYMVYGDYIKCNTCKRVTVKEWNHTTRAVKDPDKYPGELDRIRSYHPDYRYDYCWHCKSTDISPGKPNPNFYLWLHMDKNEPGYSCNLHENMWRVNNNCVYTNNLKGLTGVKSRDLALLISSWNCMLYPSGGEGYGNPAAEAMASGIPIVYSDYSSHAEFCKFGGLPIRATFQPEIANGIQRAVIDVNHAVEQMLSLTESKELCKKLGEDGRRFMTQYDLHHMVDAWDHIFTNLYNRPLPVDSNKLFSTVL